MISWAITEEAIECSNEHNYSLCSIHEALLQKTEHTYFCPECFQEVIAKKGIIIQPHFSHKEGSVFPCRSRAKQKRRSIHRTIQEAIYYKMNGEKEAAIEHFFSNIKRIADVAHFPSKTVYEIQVSWLDPQIAVERTLSYWRIGWKVVWILDSNRFHYSILNSLQEAFILCGIPYYYVKTARKHGVKLISFFDQLVEGTEIYKKELTTLFTQEKTQTLPTTRLFEWLIQENQMRKSGLIYETRDQRRDTWPYNIDDDLLEEGDNFIEKEPFFDRVLSIKEACYIALQEIWIQFLQKL